MTLIQLTNVEEVAIIDDQDWELAFPFSWRFGKRYVEATVLHPEGGLVPCDADHPNWLRKRRITLYLSRLIMGLEYGDPRQADHKNHDTLDNRRSNLEVVTGAENHQNVLSKPGSSSQYRGVHWNVKRSKWIARAKIDGKDYYLGSFTSEEEAGRVAAEWRAANMPNSAEARGRA